MEFGQLNTNKEKQLVNAERIELTVYKTKVGLFAQVFGEKSKIGDGGFLHKGSHVFLDQRLDNGSYVLACFEPHQGKYVIVPEEYFDHHLEKVNA